MGKTVPEELDTQDTWVLKTEGIVFSNTDRPWLVNNIFIFFYNRTKGTVTMTEPIRLQLKCTLYESRSAQHHHFSFFQVICSQLPVTQTPDNSNLFLFSLKVIRIQLYLFIKLRQVSGRNDTTAFSQLLWSRLRTRPRHCAHEYTFLDNLLQINRGDNIIKIIIIMGDNC